MMQRNKILRTLEIHLEYETFVVGSKLEPAITEKDEYLNKRLDLDVEPIKKEVNRTIGKLLEKNLNKEVDFITQDIVIMVDLKNVFNKKKWLFRGPAEIREKLVSLSKKGYEFIFFSVIF